MKVGTDAILLGAWASIGEAQRILDIGTGSGVIALMLAQRSDSNVSIIGIEPDLASFIQATENVNASGWSSKLQIRNVRLQDFKDDNQFDLIVSNPPYFSTGLPSPVEQRGKARHTQSLSHEELLVNSKRLLDPNGRLTLVLPINEGQRLMDFAKTAGLHCTKICSVKTRAHKPVERLLIEFMKLPLGPIREDLLLELDDGTRTAPYDALVRNFYLGL